MLLTRSTNSRAPLVAALLRGKAVIMACDTIYGIVGHFPDAEDEIRRLKGRSETHPFLVLIADASYLSSLDAILPETSILSLWPGPYSFIFPTAGGGTIACRIPGDKRLRSIIREVGAPLYSSSVNRTGQPPMDNPSLIAAEFKNENIIIEDSGRYSGRLPSTLIDLTGKPAKIVRQGAGKVPRKYLV
ncbi:MAG: hypothetical protein B0D92_08205 [Spirochaeta sp. LUC14_002_19_P3]|nr:MAG: hypothetical protein B0D92_08205 [Spirochaeta sp. LUC14_002_19_P3]